MKVSRKNAIRGWWFASSDTLPNGDGRKVVIGKHHHVKGEIEKCSRGLHSSRRAIDALQYNCGTMVYYVESWGEVDEGEDKLAASNRAYISGIDATKILEKFGRWCALSVIDKWDAPEVVVQFLKTGKASLRAAAWAAGAAWAADRADTDAAWAARAATDAAWAARSAWAATDAAWAAGAAWAADRAATDAAWAARSAWAAHAAHAAWAARAARAARATHAASAAHAAWAARAARAADWAAQNKKLESMLLHAMGRK